MTYLPTPRVQKKSGDVDLEILIFNKTFHLRCDVWRRLFVNTTLSEKCTIEAFCQKTDDI